MEIHDVAPEINALRQGMGWDKRDIDRKQILIETTAGDSHPGSVHLDRLASRVEKGMAYCGLKASHFTATDICDGIAQGHEGMNYSLVSRELLCGLTETHFKANCFDGMVAISSCDKAIPAHLMAIARLKKPAVFVPGGVMSAAAGGFTLEQIGQVSAAYRKGEVPAAYLEQCQKDACTGCGACQFMGTAGTMQVLAEALGLALPHSALIPASSKYLDSMAQEAGFALSGLLEKGITAADILTEQAFHNAIVIHGAIGGSTNALLHLPAIAHEAEIPFSIDDFDQIHREIPFLVDTKPMGRFSTELFWYAGGVPYLMMLLKEHLCLDALTVTGKTLGENLEELEKSGSLDYFAAYLKNYGLKREDLIHPISQHGAIAILKGNIAEKGAVVKYSALTESQQKFSGPARVFRDELSARNAILSREIQPGTVIVITFAGPKGSGMPEMFYTTEALCADETLSSTCAIITDGRFSGASKGPCIGHISPEAAEGGAIGLIEDGDWIEIDIPARKISAPGVDFESRRKQQVLPPIKEKGILGVYKRNAVCAADGGYME